MQLGEVIQRVDLSKRAIKYYEEQGLLTVAKDNNGYRNYSEENIRTLKEIAVFRRLGIGIQDIRTLLDTGDFELLEKVYQEKAKSLKLQQEELNALRAFIQDHDVEAVYETIDYHNIGNALQDMFPGFYGYYFMNHFMPYLQIEITTEEQREAYRNIVDFWDHTTIKLPLFLRISSYLMYRFIPRPSMEQMVKSMEAQMKLYSNPSEEEYQKLKKQTEQGIRMKNSFFGKYHPVFISQRKFMKRLQDQGYNDIFIPNMMRLSPQYKEYHEALEKVNDRICKELGLYYDSDYHLVVKK